MADALAKKELFQAAQHNDFTAVSELLQRLLQDESGAREVVKGLVEAKTKNSLLHYACDNGNLDACKFLLMCEGMGDAFLNEINTFGHTPLFYAASSGQLPLVKWLVSNGADIDTDYSDRPEIVPRDGDQGIFTALQIACFKGHEGVVNFLVECNAELAGTRRNGKTALHFASAENHPDIVKILMEAGADVHACDDQGKTPADVAPVSILPLLLPSEYPDQQDAGGDEAELEHGGGADDDTDDSFTSDDYEQVALVKNAFGADVGKGFRNSNWKERVRAINDANLCFQSAQNVKNAIKLFDAASVMIERSLHDAVSQVVSACCTTLLRSAFGVAMNEKSFHTPQFHNERPLIQRITSALMNRGAGSNEKDASEAVASLLFLICKSAELTRFVTSQISQMFTAVESAGSIALSPSKSVANEGHSSSVTSVTSSWRHQLVAIKVLNAIASQYRLDEATSGIHFAGAIKVSLQGLDNSSVHVRSAAIDLLVQSILIRCEQSEMTGTAEQMYEQMKSWTESIFKQQNQTLKPSIQAKINTGLRNALQQSKRLTSAQTDGASNEIPDLSITKSGASSDTTNAFIDPFAALSPRSKNAQKEDELPYAEPISDAQREEVGDMVACFGEKATRCMLSSAWAPRVEGLSFLQYQIEARLLSFDKKQGNDVRPLAKALQKALLQALQDRVNSVFEAGVTLLMEVAINFNNAIDGTPDVAVMHDFIRPLIPRLLIKLGDSKSRLHVTTEDALLLLSRQFASIGPEMLLEEMIACDRNASPQALSATYLANKLGLISKLLLEFGVKEGTATQDEQQHALPIKNVLQPALQACEHRDQSVRQVALQIIADALQAARSAAMPFLDAVARSSRQKLISRLVEKGALEADMLMEEVDDFEMSSEASTNRPGTSSGIRPPTASGSSTKHRPVLSSASLSAGSGSSTGGGGGGQSSSASAPLPYGTALTSEQKEMFATIIQGFGEEIVRCLLDKAWAQREAAVREVERQVVCCANGKIPPGQALPKTLDTLRNLAHVLELGLNDTVARVFQCSLRLFQVIATDFLPLITSSHEFVDEILENVVGLVLQKLGDTKQRIRQDCFTLLHSMASLSHVGHARVCKMLSEKYQRFAASSSSVASSAVIIGELLKLLTILVKEAHASSTAASAGAMTPSRPDMQLILSLVGPALDNKHVDVRNAAVATYITVFEVTSGGADEAYNCVDLNGLLAQAKPAIRDAISRSIVQIKKALPSGTDEDGDGSNTTRPEVDSARRQPVAIDTHKFSAICSSEITDMLTSSSSFQRCEGVDRLIALFLASPQKPSLKGSWEICCLLTKQLLADNVPSVCLSAFDLLRLLVDPPGSGAITTEFAIPWGEWGVHLVLGSTVRSVVQQAASESVRVRSQVKPLLQLVAGRHSVGKNAVCNALLSAPEQRDAAAAGTGNAQERKIEVAKLRWQFMLRLELLHEYLVEAARLEDAIATADLGRRRSSGTSASSSLSKQSADSLSVENLVPFLGSAVAHPSPTIRAAAHRIMQHLKSTREAEVTKFIQTGCSPALQKRVQLLLAEDFGSASNPDHLDDNEGSNVIRGSRASHVRRIAALRPPRSVPVEEKQLMADVFPPPQSAPGNSRRPSGANHQDQNDDDDMFDTKNANYVVTAPRDRSAQGSSLLQDEQQKLPIWLDQASSVPAASKKGMLSFDNDSDSIVGGGTAGLMKMRRKSGVRSGGNNGDDSDELLSSRQGVY